MGLLSRFARARQARNSTYNHNNNLTAAGSRTACILACIAAICLIFAAGAQNVSYGWQLGSAHSEFRAAVLAIASAGATLLAPLCFVAVMHSLRHWRLGTAAVALLLGCGALAYAAICSLGFVAGSRDQAISERTESIEAHSDKRAVAKAARDELASLKGQAPRIVERRRELTAILVKQKPADGTQAPPARADSQAAALGFYLRAAGYQVDDAAVGTWLNLGMVLFLELAAALSLTVASALYSSTQRKPVHGHLPGGPSTPAQPQDRPAASQEAVPERDNDDTDDPPAAKGKPGRRPTVLPTEAVERLRQKGGTVAGSINGIGKLLGTRSKTTAHRLLHQLASAGLVKLSVGPHGVAVALA